jgi:alkanesulfonate monooxygenase SsuD/methylene tetrahydromethanopterin reductase-like flavin-dependent oxidoreductase (luciferase family)
MEIGAYSFGDTPRVLDGSLGSTAEATANLFEAIVHADEAGLDYFGVGEHHLPQLPVSSPGTLVAAAAAATSRIILSSSVSVLSTDDPVRIYQQFATTDAIAPGRVEIVAGRGSTGESFPLFGYALADYDRLYAEKFELLLAINASSDGQVNWSGTVRTPLTDGLFVVPRPHNGSLPIWLGSGGSAPSSVRAGQLGVPVTYGIIGGRPSEFARLAEIYRQTTRQSGHPETRAKVAAGTWGLVAATTKEAQDRFYPGWLRVREEMGAPRGWQAPSKAEFDAMANHPGAYLVGDPDSVAERIVDLHHHIGHMRHSLQADIGGLPHEQFIEHLTLLATAVKPRVDRLLARR